MLALVLGLSLLPLLQEPDRLEQLCQELEAQRVQLQIPGMALGVVQDGKLVLARGFGESNLAAGTATQPETLFAIGSTTKAFTATLVGMLIGDGKMSWDDPVTSYLPEFKLPVRNAAAGAEVCLRDLLSHRTGFTRTDILWASGRANQKEILQASLQAEPWDDFRAEWNYNNVMFLAAGEASAKVAGMAWTELLTQRILKPLGMSSTHVSSTAVLKDKRLSTGYIWDEDINDWRVLPLRPVDSVAPAGVIYSNVIDMSHWVRFQLADGAWEGKQLSPTEVLHETWTKQMTIGGGMDYGLGWFLHDWKGKKVVQHGGNIDGFAAQVGMIPEEGVGYVLLCNVTATPLQGMSLGIVWEALLGEPPAAVAASGDAGKFDEFVGNYAADFASFRDMVFEVRVENGKLGVDVPGQMFFTLKEPDKDGKRSFDLTDQIAVSFDRDDKGAVRALRMFQSGLVFLLPREGAAPDDWSPPAEPLAAQYIGAYTFTPAKQDWTVRAPDGRLTIEVPGQTEYLLAAPDAEGWRRFLSMPENRVRFLRDADGLTTMMEYFESGVLLTLPRSAATPAEVLPTLDEVRAIFDEESRGKALAALGSLRMRGTVRFVHGGAAGTFVLALAADGRERRSVDLGVFGAMHSMVDPRGTGSGWTESDFEPFKELVGESLATAERMRERPLMAEFGAGFEPSSVLRVDEHEGQRYAVVALSGGERGALAWINLTTGDPGRLEVHEPIPGMGSMEVNYYFEDYREVGGLRIAHKIARQEDASGRIETIITSIETKVQLGDADFARPALR
jgi:CubicO group peptidase (beta-lactamase class C family)